MLDYLGYIILVCFIMFGAIKASVENPTFFNKVFAFATCYNAVMIIGAIIKIVYFKG